MKYLKYVNIIIWTIAFIIMGKIIYNYNIYYKIIKHQEKISNYKHNNPDDLPIDTKLIPLFNEFNQYAKEHNKEIDYTYLDEIVIDEIKGTEWGYCMSYNCDDGHRHYRIVMDKKILKDITGSKFVFFHEMGHFMGKEHTYCDETIIMNFSYNKENCNFINTEEDWYCAVEEFFNWEKYEDDLCHCYEITSHPLYDDYLKQIMYNDSILIMDSIIMNWINERSKVLR